jgi:hypothetical protein
VQAGGIGRWTGGAGSQIAGDQTGADRLLSRFAGDFTDCQSGRGPYGCTGIFLRDSAEEREGIASTRPNSPKANDDRISDHPGGVLQSTNQERDDRRWQAPNPIELFERPRGFLSDIKVLVSEEICKRLHCFPNRLSDLRLSSEQSE